MLLRVSPAALPVGGGSRPDPQAPSILTDSQRIFQPLGLNQMIFFLPPFFGGFLLVVLFYSWVGLGCFL